jgi:hypothetical protein
MKRAALVLSVVALLGAFPALSRGDTVVLGVEDPVNGLVAAIATSSPPILVASDGESAFDPFGAGFDVSDAIQFAPGSGWIPDPRYANSFGPGLWTLLPDLVTWVLPASNGNELINEPFGAWILPGAAWVPGTPDTQLILEADGTISDILLVTNSGPNGEAQIIFQSVPEPAGMALLGLGLGIAGVASARLRRRGARRA